MQRNTKKSSQQMQAFGNGKSFFSFSPLRLCVFALKLMAATCFFLSICFASILQAATPFESTKDLPVAFQGRFRSLEPAARLWLYDFYHLQQLKQEQLQAFNANERSALELLWKVHFMGHTPIDNAPLFWMHYAAVKSLLGLDLKQARFSFNELSQAIFEDRESNLAVMRRLLTYEFAKSYRAPSNRSRNEKIELHNLASGLWVSKRGDQLIVASAPESTPWHFLKSGQFLSDGPLDVVKVEKQDKLLAAEIIQVLQALTSYKELDGPPKQDLLEGLVNKLTLQAVAPLEIFQIIDTQYPLATRIQKAGSTLKMLPSRFNEGEWLSLHAFKLKVYNPKLAKLVLIDNFTTFSDGQFNRLRDLYLELEASALRYFSSYHGEDALRYELESNVLKFSEEMNGAYGALAGKPYREAIGKTLTYPSLWQLRAESLYYRLPLIEISILCYGVSLILFLLAYAVRNNKLNPWAFGVLLLAFLFHTMVLVMRCYVLERPPVSNMFETVVYVPWIAVLIGLILQGFLRNRLILIAACTASLGLLILLKLTDVDARLDNVQAVLDSQYWLIVHVLMIVGSYGVFVICGILGHFFLILCAKNRTENESTNFLAKCIQQTMYIGVALLIPGTILGGVWAAESWGRFWDWDPKESWAFISVCVYLLIIHAHTFRKIQEFGLAIGSVVGLMAISFTWYGVNYVLGTGLHSYGFGKGGEVYYFGYLAIETLFLTVTSIIFLFFKKTPKKPLENK